MLGQGAGQALSSHPMRIRYDSHVLRLSVLVATIAALGPAYVRAQVAQTPPPPPPMEDSPRLPVGDAPTMGPASALVTIVLFGSPRDPFSASTRPTLRALRTRYANDVRIVWRTHPIIANSPDGRIAAEALMAAHAQRHFWELLDRLYDATSPLTPEIIERIAGELHLDVPRLHAALAAHADAARVDADVRLGATLHVGDYAPVFVINGTIVPGAHSIERLSPLIDAALTAARSANPRSSAYRIAVEHPLHDPEGFPEPPPGRSRVRDRTVLYRVPIAGAPVAGPADALVTVIAFEDFQCPVCVRSEPVIQQMRQRYGNDLRFVFRNLPLWIHLDAIPAAEAGMEAYAQGGNAAFWRYHDAIFSHSADPAYVTRAALERYAGDVGLDVARFRTALDRRTHGAHVRDDIRLATRLGVGGTPAFFVNGRVLTGFQSAEAFTQAIDAALVEARARVAAGVARAQLYDTLTAGAATEEVFLPAEPGGTEPRYPVTSRAGAPSRGPANAPVTVLLFAGMEGQASVRTTATVEALAQRHARQVRIEYRNFFVDSVHPHARMSAEAALEAFAQRGIDGFVHYRDTLFANQAALARADLERYAESQHLDMTRFRAALDTHSHRPEIAGDNDAARAFGFAFEAPVTFVNGRRLGPGTPAAQFEEAVNRALAGAPAATPRPAAHGGRR